MCHAGFSPDAVGEDPRAVAELLEALVTVMYIPDCLICVDFIITWPGLSFGVLAGRCGGGPARCRGAARSTGDHVCATLTVLYMQY
jgi:hypothetical protein